MTRYRILPYKSGSRSAKALAEALGGRVLKLVGSTFNLKPNDIVINWGLTSEGYDYSGLLNHPLTVKRASNKLLFFENMAANAPGITPKFWKTKEEILDEEYPVVCRTLLAGHSGAGIVIASCPDDLVDAKLYVKYIPKKEEYRIHAGLRHIPDTGSTVEVFSVQRKARRSSVPDGEINWKVRNLHGGFVFTRTGFTIPDAVIEVTRRALEASCLDFGAVDVIYNQQKDKAYVLEINTAPGLEGQTIQDYANFFKG